MSRILCHFRFYKAAYNFSRQLVRSSVVESHINSVSCPQSRPRSRQFTILPFRTRCSEDRVGISDRDWPPSRPSGDTVRDMAVFRRRPHTRGEGAWVKPGTCTGHSTITTDNQLPITEAEQRAAAAGRVKGCARGRALAAAAGFDVATCWQRGFCLTPGENRRPVGRARMPT